LVIAKHSPQRRLETGLLIARSEKKSVSKGLGWVVVPSLPSDLLWKYREIRAFSGYFD